MKDSLYTDPKRSQKPFTFDSEVAAVFDNMLDRSIPLYATIQDMIRALVLDVAETGTTIYDLGCSTGKTLCHLAPELPRDTALDLVGIDLSQEMLDQAESRRQALCPNTEITWIVQDLNSPPQMSNASVIILNLCYQFIRPENKAALLTACYEGLRTGGTLIVVEKILAGHYSETFQHHYEAFKRSQGYSQSEIDGKKKALQGVLDAVTPEQLASDLREAGLEKSERFFQWFNFMGLVAKKDKE